MYASSRWAAAAKSPSPCSSASEVARSSASAPSSSRPRAEWTSAVPRASQDSASSVYAPHAFASAAARASERTPGSKLPALIAERPASRAARAACFPAARAAGTGAGGVASAARKTAVPGALPCSAPKELQAGRDLPIRRLPIAALGVAADEQLLIVLVVRIQLHQTRRKPDGCGRLACRQAVERSFVEGRLGRAKQAASLAEEPGLEGGRVAELHPVEQLASKAGDCDRLLGGSTCQRVDVHKSARGERELRGAAGQRGWAQCSTKLGQVPAQRAERIVGARE
jgi:hypothetical protein